MQDPLEGLTGAAYREARDKLGVLSRHTRRKYTKCAHIAARHEGGRERQCISCGDTYVSRSPAQNKCRPCDTLDDRARKLLKKENPKPPPGPCPICFRPTGTPDTPWALDHCHTTMEFRGFICVGCNQALGLLKDDIPNLARAVLYLREFEEAYPIKRKSPPS